MRCSVCRSGYSVGKPNAVVSFKDSLKISCGSLDSRQVRDQFLSEQDCILMSAQIFQECGCVRQHRHTLRRKHPVSLFSRGSEGTSLLAKNPNRNTSSTWYNFFYTAIFMVPNISPLSLPQDFSHSRKLQEFRAESIFIPIFLIWAVICLCTICLNCKRSLDNRPIQVPGPRNDGRIRESVTRNRPLGTGVVARPTPPPVHVPHFQNQGQSNEVNTEMRRRVLQNLFPKQDYKKEQRVGPPSRRALKYDRQSKRYISSTDDFNIRECTICLEEIGDDVIVGICSHVYHRSCIMEWIEYNHDDCPNCRQRLWDPIAYKMIEESMEELDKHRQKSEMSIAV